MSHCELDEQLQTRRESPKLSRVTGGLEFPIEEKGNDWFDCEIN